MDLTSNVIINLTANDTTPDVTHIDVGKTANTQTTLITYFDGNFHAILLYLQMMEELQTEKLGDGLNCI